jgi:hypothetical protein
MLPQYRRDVTNFRQMRMFEKVIAECRLSAPILRKYSTDARQDKSIYNP